MERGGRLARKAQALIMAGQVRVNDQVALKPATAIDTKSSLTVDPPALRLTRRRKAGCGAGAFAIDVKGLVCAM